MAKSVIGLFDDFGQAQSVVRDLTQHGFRREDISLIANDSTRQHGTMLGQGGETHAHEDVGTEAGHHAGVGAGIGAGIGGLTGLLVGLGALAIPGIGPIIAAGPIATALAGAGIGAMAGGLIGALTGMGVPEEEAHYYAEGVRRGGTLVAVKTSDEMADEAYNIMARHRAVDIERRATTWRQEGWQRFDHEAQPFNTDQMTTERGRYQQEEHIPIVEEELHVGTRQVQRGGARIHTWTEEVPVQEQVNVHEERVRVDRRPVDRPVTAREASDAFRERTVEMVERGEEVVKEKQARVREEVVVRKEAEEHTETVRDTVRRTDVEVENLDPTRTGMTTGTTPGTTTGYDTGATSGGTTGYTTGATTGYTTGTTTGGMTGGMTGGRFEDYDADFRRHYDTNFNQGGLAYDRYLPAYRYGHELGSHEGYRGRDWTSIEPDARRSWEERHGSHGRWEDFKDAIRHGWERTRR